ncbi:unnamed protein product [Sphagnum tenellum]
MSHNCKNAASAGYRGCNSEEVFTCYTEEHCPPTFHVASCILCVGGLTGIIVYALDKLIASMHPPGTEKFTFVVDLQGVSYCNMDPAAMCILPTRLAKAFVVHVSTIFWGVWHMISPFVGKVTKEKITFVEERALEIY